MALPLQSPKHKLCVVSVIDDVNSNAGSIISTSPLSKQLLLSDNSNFHVPAHRDETDVSIGKPNKLYQTVLYGAVPPIGVIEMKPLQTFLHNKLTVESIVKSRTAGSDRTIVAVSSHPKES